MASTLFRWWLVVVCYVSLGSNSAHADDPLATPNNPEARQHLVRGNRLYRTREFAQAVEEYKAGVLIQDAPLFYYNLGQCHRQLGNHKEALWYYEHFLKRGKPTGELRELVESLIAGVKAEQAKAITRPPAEPAPPQQPSPALLPPKPLEPPPASVVTREPWHRDRVGLAITAVGVVGAGISGALFLSARSLEADANREDRDLSRSELRDRVHTRRLAGSIAGIAGTGLAIAGIIKLAIPSRDRSSSPAFGVVVSKGEVVLVGSFSAP